MATKKRQPRKLARVTAERLEELRVEANLTVAEFAERCKLPGKPSPAHTTFVAWRTGGSIPGGEYLRQIAVEFGVTTDWLLGIAGAAKHPNQTRSESALAEDLAGAVERELRQRVPPTVPGAPEPFVWRARTAFLADVESLNRAVRPITDRLARGEDISEREAAIAQRLLAVSQRILERVEPQAEAGSEVRVMLFPESVAESA
jgi:transcriptional regulator with XRE-family HTH domain